MYPHVIQQRLDPVRVQPIVGSIKVFSTGPEEEYVFDQNADTLLILEWPNAPLSTISSIEEHVEYVFDILGHERTAVTEATVRLEASTWQGEATLDAFPVGFKTETWMRVSSEKLRLASSRFKAQFSTGLPSLCAASVPQNQRGRIQGIKNVILACGWDQYAMRLLMAVIHRPSGVGGERSIDLPAEGGDLNNDFEIALMLHYYCCHSWVREAIAPFTWWFGRRDDPLEFCSDIRKYATIASVFRNLSLTEQVFSTLVYESRCPFDPYNLPISSAFLVAVEETRERLFLTLIRVLNRFRADHRESTFTFCCSEPCTVPFMEAVQTYEASCGNMSIEKSSPKALCLLLKWTWIGKLLKTQTRCTQGEQCVFYQYFGKVCEECDEIVSRGLVQASGIISSGSDL